MKRLDARTWLPELLSADGLSRKDTEWRSTKDARNEATQTASQLYFSVRAKAAHSELYLRHVPAYDHISHYDAR